MLRNFRHRSQSPCWSSTVLQTHVDCSNRLSVLWGWGGFIMMSSIKQDMRVQQNGVMDASVALVIIKHHLSPLTEELHSIMTDLTPQLSVWRPYVCHLRPPLHPISLLKPCCHNLSHSLYPCLCPCSCVWPPLPWTLLQDQKKNYKAVQSCEEGGSGGAYLEPLVALAQNGANMHNVLGPACIFLRKGFAESRQAVRKSRWYHEHACPELSSQERTFPITERWGMRAANPSHCDSSTYSMLTNSLVDLRVSLCLPDSYNAEWKSVCVSVFVHEAASNMADTCSRLEDYWGRVRVQKRSLHSSQWKQSQGLVMKENSDVEIFTVRLLFWWRTLWLSVMEAGVGGICCLYISTMQTRRKSNQRVTDCKSVPLHRN